MIADLEHRHERWVVRVVCKDESEARMAKAGFSLVLLLLKDRVKFEELIGSLDGAIAPPEGTASGGQL